MDIRRPNSLKMMAQPKFSIGIDLGTTNCALSYVALNEENARSQILAIPQRDELHTEIEASTLPSFLCLPPKESRIRKKDSWIIGSYARKQTLVSPGRVAHSAKSWLAHHSVDPESRILPWKSKDLADDEKLSPLGASALLLGYLKRCWDEHFASQGAAYQFTQQSVVITVPASFDAASQKATLEAARQAGFPESTRLLEEPQAAFYRWLESENSDVLKTGQRILVVDIGGGTSDFSLFQVGAANDDESAPAIERVAVSDHILLGGDNIDLALAHALESELVSGDDELNLDQWGHLIARAREVKEHCLAAGESSAESVNVSLPSQGSGLFAGSRSTRVSSSDVRELLLEGFFPLCPKSARPVRPEGALLEWGLPYAPDCAVTRYLAEFLKEQPAVDAVLFNGGTLAAGLIQDRLLEQFSNWQNGATPVSLKNAETDLAVARGAAAYGAVIARKEPRIEAGAARALYMEVASDLEGGEKRLIAILPRGAPADEVYRIDLDGLQLAVNQVARFQIYRGAHECDDDAGNVRKLDTKLFSRLPALEAKIDHVVDAGVQSVPVSLQCRVNELGLLEVVCVSEAAGQEGQWSLEFNLREDGLAADESPSQSSPGVAAPRREKAAKALKGGLNDRADKSSRILKDLEKVLRKTKNDWDLALSRELGDVVLARSVVLEKGEAQAENWYQLAGYLLRPGFGDPKDGERIQNVLNLGSKIVSLPKRLEVQSLIMWRRIAAGLSATEQIEFFDREFAALENPKKATAERIRLLGALERVDVERKTHCVNWLLDEAMKSSKSDGYPAPCFSALGQLLSRVPFHAGPDAVLPPELVVNAFDRLAKLDWKDPRNTELIPLFLKAARLVDDRALDLPTRAGKKIAKKLEKSGVATARCTPLLGYVPLSRSDKVSIFGEALPVGLVLTNY